MNKQGKEYIQSIQIKYKELPLESREIIDKRINDSSIYERLMRLWQESRYYELHTDEEHRQIAIATLKDDFIESNKYLLYAN